MSYKPSNSWLSTLVILVAVTTGSKKVRRDGSLICKGSRGCPGAVARRWQPQLSPFLFPISGAFPAGPVPAWAAAAELQQRKGHSQSSGKANVCFAGGWSCVAGLQAAEPAQRRSRRFPAPPRGGGRAPALPAGSSRGNWRAGRQKGGISYGVESSGMSCLCSRLTEAR